MVPKRAKEAPKTSEGLPVLLPVSIQGKQDNMKYRVSRKSTLELKKTVIHQRHTPGQHWGAGRSLSKIIDERNTVETNEEE